MPKLSRRFFTKGSRMIDLPNDGEARFIHDAWVQDGRLRPITQPDMTQGLTPTVTNARGLWSYMGRQYASSNRRNYAIVRTNWMETIAITEETAPTTVGAYPKKQVNGLEMALGLPTPVFAPGLGLIPWVFQANWINVGPIAAGGTVNNLGITNETNAVAYPPTVPSTCQMLFVPVTSFGNGRPTPQPSNSAFYDPQYVCDSGKHLILPRYYMGNTVNNYLIFMGPPGQEGYAGTCPPGSLATNIGNSSAWASVSTVILASSFNFASTVLGLTYVYTFWYDDGFFQSESAPSPLSPQIATTNNLPLTFDPINDGFWTMAGRIDITDFTPWAIYGPAAFVQPTGNPLGWPASVDLANLTATAAFPGGNTQIPTTSPVPSGNTWAITQATNVMWISSCGLCFQDASGNLLDVEVPLGKRPDTAGTLPVAFNQFVISDLTFTYATPTAGTNNLPTAVSKVEAIHGGVLPAATGPYPLDPSTGMVKIVIGNGHGIANGENILFFSVPNGTTYATPLAIGNTANNVYLPSTSMRCKLPVTLSATAPGTILVPPPTTGWAWNSEPKYWCRDLFHILLRNPNTVSAGSQGTLAPGLDNIPDGTLVLLQHPSLGSPRQGILHSSYFGIHIELSDSTGLEFVFAPNTTLIGSGAGSAWLNGWTISYYPKNNYIKGRMLYRIGDSTQFQQVGLIPLNQTSFFDGVNTQALGPVISGWETNSNGVNVQNDPPPADLHGVVNHHGVLLGISRGTARWTKAGQQDAWPEEYCENPDDIPVAIISGHQAAIVLCQHSIWRLDGTDPGSYSWSKTPASEGCLAPRSVITVPGTMWTPPTIVFLGYHGIVSFDGYRTNSLTEGKLYPWQLFPNRQLNQDTSLKAGFALGTGQVADSSKGDVVGWAPAMECASFVEAMAVDGSFGLSTCNVSYLGQFAEAVYYQGKYILYLPADLTPETQGTWILHMDEQGMPLTHVGLCPYAISVDGQDLNLLLRGE